MNTIVDKFKPTVSEETIAIGFSLEAVYTQFKNNFSYTRVAGTWANWTEKLFVAPTENYFITDPFNEGVKFGCYEHVSVCVAGKSDYTLVGDTKNVTYEWGVGAHNVENGWGYLPKDNLTRIFYDNFTLCCILCTPNKPENFIFNFEIIKASQNLTRDYSFAHVALGHATYNDVQYEQKQTVYNLTNGSHLDIEPNSILILGWGV